MQNERFRTHTFTPHAETLSLFWKDRYFCMQIYDEVAKSVRGQSRKDVERSFDVCSELLIYALEETRDKRTFYFLFSRLCSVYE